MDAKLLEKVQKAKASSDRKPIKTWSRASTITPEMVGLTFSVHNGKNFIPVLIKEEMVGRRLGEFSPTRKFTKHGGKIQKELDAAKVAAEAEKAKQASAAPSAVKK